MRVEIARDQRFEAAHRLPYAPEGHKCARLHGHSFRVTLTITGEVDAQTGWILDFATIDEAWRPLHAQLDHRHLNEVEGLSNPTSEHLATWIFRRLELPAGKLAAVTVHETCAAACTVYAE